MRAVERDNADTSAKNKDSLEAMNKVKELHRAIEAIREDIHAMPGIERSKSDQLKQLQALRSVFIMSLADYIYCSFRQTFLPGD